MKWFWRAQMIILLLIAETVSGPAVAAPPRHGPWTSSSQDGYVDNHRPLRSDHARFWVDRSRFGVAGDGCPSGSATPVVSPDGATVTVLFSMFVVAVGPGQVAKTAQRCTTRIPITVLEGYAWAMSTTTYRGYADLHDGVQAKQSINYTSPGRQRRKRHE